MGLCYSAPGEPKACNLSRNVHSALRLDALSNETAAENANAAKPEPASPEPEAAVPSRQQPDCRQYFREVRLKAYAFSGEGGCISFLGCLNPTSPAGAPQPVILTITSRNVITDDAMDRLQRFVGRTNEYGLLKRLAVCSEHLEQPSSAFVQQISSKSNLPSSGAHVIYRNFTCVTDPTNGRRQRPQWSSCPATHSRQQLDHKDVSICISGPCISGPSAPQQPVCRLAAENSDIAAALSYLRLTPGQKILACIDEMPELHGNLLQSIQGTPGRSQSCGTGVFLAYATQVAQAMAHLHSGGVHHGSLTPAAVLLVPEQKKQPAAEAQAPVDPVPAPAPEGPPAAAQAAAGAAAAKPPPRAFRCKVALYGLVNPVEHAGRLACHAAGWGAVSYLAPECFTADAAEVTLEMLMQMDVHAFGALCYHLFTGMAPYHQYHAAQVLVGLTAGGLQLDWPAHPDGRASGRSPVPAPIRQLVGRCLDRNPEARPDFGEIVSILEAVRGRVSGPP